MADEAKQRIHTDIDDAAIAAGGVHFDYSGGKPELQAMAMDPDAPRVYINDYDTATHNIWEHLEAINDPQDASNFLFRYGDVLARLESNDDGHPHPVPEDIDKLSYRINHRVQLVRRTEEGDKRVAHAPTALARNVAAMPEPPVPVVRRVVDYPVLGPDGKVCQGEGYHEGSRVFHAPSAKLKVPEVSNKPTPSEIARARGLLLDELFGDFPFRSRSDDEGNAERAHALCMLIQPFVRSLYEGPSPLYLIEAPERGTGKGLLYKVGLWPAIGYEAAIMTEGGDEGEWRKRITAKLRTGPTAVVIDNVRAHLDSSNLSAALTTTWWEDRIMRTSTLARLPNYAVWIVTGNNVTMSDEIMRRVVRIRMDARMDHPETRSNFKHKKLEKWVADHRGELIWAALTLGRAWWVHKHKQSVADVPSIGSYESWARVMGGICAVADVPGFLGNLDELRATAGSERSDVLTWLSMWHRYHGSAEVTLSALNDEVLRVFGIERGMEGEARRLQSLGKQLHKHKDRRVEGYALRRGGTTGGVARWYVEFVQSTASSSKVVPLKGRRREGE